MALIDQVNKIDCSASGSLGTGLAGCRIDRDRVVALGLLTKGYKFTEEISLDYMQELQVAGTLTILQGVITFVDNTAEDTIITRDGSGVKKVAGQMPYEYAATFDNGVNFHKALTSLSSYEGYDVILFDVNNNIWFTSTKSGDYKGFSLGMFKGGKYTGANGTDSASQTVNFQIINRLEVDSLMSWAENDKLDFTYDELQGVNEVFVKVDPIVAGTSITVSAFLLDGTHPVEGLVKTDFKATINGVVDIPSAASYNPTTKKYTLTVSAMVSTNVITVSLNGIVLTILGTLYKSNTVNAIVA